MGALKRRMHASNNEIREAYHAGFVDGQAEAQKLLNLAIRTNCELWEGMLTLDAERPGGGTGVLLPLSFAQTLVKSLRQPELHTKHSQVLAGYVKRANESTRELVEKLNRLADDGDAGPGVRRPTARTRSLIGSRY